MFVLLLIAALAAEAPLMNLNTPDIEHAPELAETTPFDTVITVQNPNDKAVRVVRLDATCTCARLELGSMFLLPHATTTLHLSVDDTNRSGPQRLGVSLYLSDPDLEAIEVVGLWKVRAHVQVDSLSGATSTLERPALAFRDVYRYPSKVRPDELHKLEKRLRLSCPSGEVPAGGLMVQGIDYPGSLWTFTSTTQEDGSILIDARGPEGMVAIPEGVLEEKAVVRTNHPVKSSIELVFITYVGKDAGSVVFDPHAEKFERDGP